jgi:hypothetical protein
VYVFFDSRGQAIYAGKAKRQTLWKEMTAAFNRARDSVQRIKRVRHPKRRVAYRTSDEKARVAMELRYAQRARATRDLDLGMAGTRKERMARLVTVLQLGFDHFTFRLKQQTLDMQQADTVRVEIAIAYKTRGWQTVEVDLGPAKAANVDLVEAQVAGLTELGVPLTTPIRCLGLSDQVAQKLHACTGPASTGRARDVLDILLIDTLGQLDYTQTAAAARAVFQERATHDFPPAFKMPREWRPELEALATELDFVMRDADLIENAFYDVLDKLSRAN